MFRNTLVGKFLPQCFFRFWLSFLNPFPIGSYFVGLGTSSILCRALLVLILANNLSSIRAVELTGEVRNESGVAIEGARVDISTAAPIDGPSVFCPSCYLDCLKWATTDATGRFTISSLDDNLKFRLVVTSPGKRTHRTELIEPGEIPLAIRLHQTPDDLPPSRMLRGRVLSVDGLPISGALVEPVKAKTKDLRWRNSSGNAWNAVTNDSGEFAMEQEDDFVGVDIQVTAHGYPGTIKAQLAPGNTIHEVELNSGCKVFGRVEYSDSLGGLPTIAAVQIDRGNFDRPFLKAVPARILESGHFEFPQLPPNEFYALFSLVNQQGGDRPVISTTLFLCGDDGQSMDLGVIQSSRGYSISGKLLSQGVVLPNNLFVSLRRAPAWDLVKVPVAEDGSFVLDNLPPESYDLVINTDSVEIDFNNFRYQPTSSSSFGIRPFGESVVEIPLRERGSTHSQAKRTQAKRTVTGRIVNRRGEPIGGVSVVPTAFSANRKLGKSITTKSDGRFAFASIPSEPFELFYYKPGSYHYPRTKAQRGGNTLLFPGKLSVYSSHSDLQVIFDPGLVTRFPLIEATSDK